MHCFGKINSVLIHAPNWQKNTEVNLLDQIVLASQEEKH